MVCRPIISAIPFSFIKRIGSCKLIIVYYHLVNDEEVPHIRNLYQHKSTSQFTRDLEFLLKHYSPIGLSDVIQRGLDKYSLPPNCFLLTFDDGLREIADVIAPILLEKGIPATFFISSAFLDNRELCYQHKASLLVEKIRQGISPETGDEIKRLILKLDLSFLPLSEGILKVDYRHRASLDKIADILSVDFQQYLNEKQPYLTSSEINNLINRGFAIGAHSVDHPYYSTISLDEQVEQTIISIKQIREKFALDYGAFAFPHNDTGVSHEYFNRINDSGIVDIIFGTGGMLSGSVRSNKQRVSLENPLLPARDILAWQYMRKIYKRLK